VCTDLSAYFIVVDCGPPTAPANGSIENVTKTMEGGTTSFRCNRGFAPQDLASSVCASEGRWDPAPEAHACIGKYYYVIQSRQHVH
jgi:hypothetical protein